MLFNHKLLPHSIAGVDNKIKQILVTNESTKTSHYQACA